SPSLVHNGDSAWAPEYLSARPVHAQPGRRSCPLGRTKKKQILKAWSRASGVLAGAGQVAVSPSIMCILGGMCCYLLNRNRYRLGMCCQVCDDAQTRLGVLSWSG